MGAEGSVSSHGGNTPESPVTASASNPRGAMKAPYHSPAQAQYLENESEFYEATLERVVEEELGLALLDVDYAVAALHVTIATAV